MEQQQQQQEHQQQQGALLVPEAAVALGIPESTLRLWIRQGKVPSLPPARGERGVRLTAETVEGLRQAKPLTWDGSALVGGEPADGSNSSNSRGDSNNNSSNGGLAVPAPPVPAAAAEGASLETSAAPGPSGPPGAPETAPGAAHSDPGGEGAPTAPAVADAPLVAALQREREQLTAEVSFLRDQVAARTQAESELRVLLAHQARALTAALETRALPAIATAEVADEGPAAVHTAPAGDGAAEEPTAARRRPWWRPWGRG